MQELSLNVLDVAQNGITAGADLIEIIVEEDTADDRLMIRIHDNGGGMTPEQVAQVTDPFYTTRTTRRVGLGVSLFKMAAEMSGGAFTIGSEPGAGTQVCASFILSHIDRAPLGDMCSTVCVLIRCNPHLDFIYRYSIDRKSFTLDTREVRETLGGDIPLDTPEVLAFIEEYIKENTREVHGGI